MVTHKEVHNDVMQWKRYPYQWPFVRGILRSLQVPFIKPLMRTFNVSFVVSLNNRHQDADKTPLSGHLQKAYNFGKRIFQFDENRKLFGDYFY